ncbi:MAG: AraC family transcriptional regulator N-terminal domain-containing protein [Verrucomicrobium sp.]|nr:AraC family transcriptional regulator [Verrucomicrobium sp.]
MSQRLQTSQGAIPPPTHPRLVSLLAGLARGEGYSSSRLPGVRFMRSTKTVPRMQVSYEPSIIIVGQGRKRGHLGGQTFTYDANNYLVLAVPLPFECDTDATPDEPMLGVAVGVSPATVAELLMDMAKVPPVNTVPSLAMRAFSLDDGLTDATIRLLECLEDNDDARILGPQIVREITYRVLRGEQGGVLRSLAAPHSHFGQISRALQRMHGSYAEPMDMTTLASEAGMSLSTFHTHFKAVTSSSPLQYLKSVRLHKARMLMVHQSASASVAAREVGYESASQFSREFKRFFGLAPAAEAEHLRTMLMQLV